MITYTEDIYNSDHKSISFQGIGMQHEAYVVARSRSLPGVKTFKIINLIIHEIHKFTREHDMIHRYVQSDEGP